MNRGVEIDSHVADGAASVILPQVTFGIAIGWRCCDRVFVGEHVMNIAIVNGRVIDPANALDKAAGVTSRTVESRRSVVRRTASNPIARWMRKA